MTRNEFDQLLARIEKAIKNAPKLHWETVHASKKNHLTRVVDGVTIRYIPTTVWNQGFQIMDKSYVLSAFLPLRTCSKSF
jgi:hypothetical protein